MVDLDKMTKPQLLGIIKDLQQQQINAVGNRAGDQSALGHELQVYQVELEMQNRELREAQSELEATRDRYADLYDFAPVTYITFDRHGIVKNINRTGAAMLSHVRARIIGHPFSTWVVKSDLNIFFRHLRTVLASDVNASTNLKIRGSDSQLYDVRIESVRSKGDLEGEYVCRSILSNITEQVQHEVEIALQTRQLRLIADALPVLISYININETHLFANKTYADWFGYSLQDIVGMTTVQVWGDTNYSRFSKYINISLGGKKVTFDMDVPFSNDKKHINVILIPDLDINQQVCGIIALMGDITDRLANEVIDRARLLETAHFSRLSTMGEMASEIAHELNQPLAAISIYSDACRRMIQSKSYDRDKITKSLVEISRQAERAGDVIRRVREFTSKKELAFSDTSINEITDEALRLIAVELRSHNVTLHQELADALPLVKLDRILIEQVILNLARNALEAMDDIDKSHRAITIQTSRRGPQEVEVSIHDTGPGLTEEQIKKIFEPFHTTKTNGMGLGLTICQSIISAHHGRLWAISNQDGGSTFSFTLPVSIPSLSEEKAHAP